MKFHIAYLVITLASFQVAAQNQFESIENLILENNPEIMATARSNNAQASAALAENLPGSPEVEFEHLWGKDGNKKWNIGVTQSFDWPGSYSARSKANNAGAYAMSMMLEAERSDLKYKSRCLLLDIVGVRKQLEFNDSIISNLTSVLNRTERAMQKGQATRLDVSKVEFALISLRQERELLLTTLDTNRRSLKAMNGGKAIDISSINEYPAEILLSDEAYLNNFDSNAPVPEAARARIAAAKAEADAVRWNSWPGLSVGYRHAFEESTHFNGFSIGLTLPVYSAAKKRKAAMLSAESETFNSEAYIIGQHAIILSEAAKARRLKSQLNEYERLFNDSDYLGILKRLYENAQMNVIDYITEINYFLGVRLQYLKLQSEYQLTLASLNRYN